jgi:hypothetical protein
MLNIVFRDHPSARGVLMPRFYFDYFEGAEAAIDDEGVTFPDLATARRNAEIAACERLKDNVPGGQREISIAVRSECGMHCVVSASLKHGGGHLESARRAWPGARRRARCPGHPRR